MKNLVFLFSFFILSSLSLQAINPVASPIQIEKGESPFWASLTHDELLTLSPKEIRQKTGQKLKFKEKIALSVGRKAYRKSQRQIAKGKESKSEMDKTSVASFVLSSLGFLGLFLSFAIWWLVIPGIILGIIALARKGNYDQKRGKGFAIAGVIIGGLSFLLVIAAVILVLSFI